MKTVIFRLGGFGSPGDVLVLSAASARGGQSHARYFCHGETSTAYLDGNGDAQKKVTVADTPQEMTEGIAEALNRSGEFSHDHVTGSAKGDLLVVSCSDVYHDCTWSIEVQGQGQTESFVEI